MLLFEYLHWCLWDAEKQTATHWRPAALPAQCPLVVGGQRAALQQPLWCHKGLRSKLSHWWRALSRLSWDRSHWERLLPLVPSPSPSTSGQEGWSDGQRGMGTQENNINKQQHGRDTEIKNLRRKR